MKIWPWSTIRRLREALADARREARIWEIGYDNATEREARMIGLNRTLEAQLAEATKNDKRDSKTGRFVKGSE